MKGLLTLLQLVATAVRQNVWPELDRAAQIAA